MKNFNSKFYCAVTTILEWCALRLFVCLVCLFVCIVCLIVRQQIYTRNRTTDTLVRKNSYVFDICCGVSTTNNYIAQHIPQQKMTNICNTHLLLRRVRRITRSLSCKMWNFQPPFYWFKVENDKCSSPRPWLLGILNRRNWVGIACWQVVGSCATYIWNEAFLNKNIPQSASRDYRRGFTTPFYARFLKYNYKEKNI